MSEWWEALTALEKGLYLVAIPSTLIFILQAILLLIGIGEGGSGIDDIDVGPDLTDALDDGSNPMDFDTFRLFSVQSVMALLCVFSWTAVSMLHNDCSVPVTLVVALLAGVVMMFVVSWLIHSMKKLAQNGTMEINNALGATGSVYLRIPPKGQGIGKVNVMIQGQLQEMDAVTDGEEAIPTGASVRIVDVRNSQLVVEAE